jgi:hypothetical protein
MNSTLPISFGHKFRIATYRCSHSQLLLRSEYSPTRLDILFKDVSACELRTFLSGLSIEEVDADQLKDRASNAIDAMEDDQKIYLLKSEGWSGYVVAGAVFWHEDDGKFCEPSAFMPEVTLLG